MKDIEHAVFDYVKLTGNKIGHKNPETKEESDATKG